MRKSLKLIISLVFGLAIALLSLMITRTHFVRCEPSPLAQIACCQTPKYCTDAQNETIKDEGFPFPERQIFQYPQSLKTIGLSDSSSNGWFVIVIDTIIWAIPVYIVLSLIYPKRKASRK